MIDLKVLLEFLIKYITKDMTPAESLGFIIGIFKSIFSLM